MRNNIILQKNGFGVAGALVTSALIGILSLGVLRLVGTSMDSQKAVEQRQGRLSIEGEAQLYLSDSAACKNTFQGLLVVGTGSPVPAIKDAGNNKKFETSSSLNYQGIRIQSIRIGDFVPGSKPGLGVSQVSIRVTKVGSLVGGALKDITFPLITEVDATDRLKDCYALGEFRSLWKLGSAGDIYYNSGSVAIGKNNPTAELDITGNSVVSGTSFANAFIYTSDIRLKEDISPIANPLHTLSKLNGVHFTWKESGKKDIGLIAQEVESVLPELVQTKPGSDYKAVKYGNLVALLIEATKSQQKEIRLMKEEIRQLKRNKNRTTTSLAH